MTPRFLYPALPIAEGNTGSNLTPLTVALDDAAAHHARTVLRLAAGDAVELFDGEGHSAAGLVQRMDKREVLIAVTGPWRTQPTPVLSIHVGLALLQGDKMDWAIEKLVELGVAQITVIAAQRSKVKLDGDRAARRIEHWRHIAQAAAAQCGRNDLPLVDGIVPAKAWWPQAGAAQQLADSAHGSATVAPMSPLQLLLDPQARLSLTSMLSQQGAMLDAPMQTQRIEPHRDPQPDAPSAPQAAGHQAPRSIMLATGPESGWTDEECASSQQHGWQTVKFGPRVLRAETAPIAACAAIQALSGDLR